MIALTSVFLTMFGTNLSLTFELGMFFFEEVNDFSRIVLNFEMNLYVC